MHTRASPPLACVSFPFCPVPSNNYVQILAEDQLPKNCIYQDKHKINIHPTQTRHTESLVDLPTMLAGMQSLVITELKWQKKKRKRKWIGFTFLYCSSPNHDRITSTSVLKCSGLRYPFGENRYRKLQPLSQASKSSKWDLRTLSVLREQVLLQTDRKRPSFPCLTGAEGLYKNWHRHCKYFQNSLEGISARLET